MAATTIQLAPSPPRGCWGGLFGERLKDRCCTEGGGDGIWARKECARCGGQPTLPTEERNFELLGCGCGKACPIAQFASPFEHCHTRFRSVSGSGAQRGVAEVWVAAVSSATVLTETWLSFRPCSTRGPEGARLSFPISPVEMLATATDSWTRLRSVAALMCICRAARGCCLGVGAGPTVCVCVHPGAYCGCAACEARRSLERGGRGRHAPQVADTAAAHRRVCVIAGLRVSGMPASTGRREQSVCFFAGGRAGVPHQNVG